MNKKGAFYLVILLMILGGLITVGHIWGRNYRHYSTYCRDYYSVVAKTEIPTYKGILEANVKPNKEWVRVEGDNEDAKFICLEYKDGRVFGFWINMAEQLEFCNVEITGSEYCFGKKNIGIGTEKRVIEQAYKNSYINLFDDKKIVIMLKMENVA